MTEILAVNGGVPETEPTLPIYNPLGEEEVNAVMGVMQSGILSDFIGAPGDKFLGGDQVLAFESCVKEYYGVKHAISVNSLTSGLICAIGAVGIEPGDEVIVTPWSMSASATCIVVWNAIPVFADIDAVSFNIDPVAIEKKISPRTKAIVVPSIFGNPADFERIMSIAERYDLKVIEDAAQAPGVRYRGRYVGTIGDIGGFSFNYHKHVHTGEGGMMVTDDDDLAQRMRLIRNHAESALTEDDLSNLSNLIGFNFRLGEIESAIGIQQMKKIDEFVAERYRHAEQLSSGLRKLPGIQVPTPQADCGHAYYVYPIVIDPENLGVDRAKIVDALVAEGVQGLAKGYVNIHRLPMFKKRMAFGSNHFPWSIPGRESDITYGDGLCPIAESLHDERYIGFVWCQHHYTEADIDTVIRCFEKVWRNLESLR